MTRLWLPTDPPARRPTGAPDVFDHAPHRNMGQPGILRELEAVPDSLLISTAVELGCDPIMAEQCRYHPPARFALALVWCMVQDAAEGDPAAAAAVDRYRHAFEHSTDVGEMIAAAEQPADPDELQSLMALD